MKSVLITGAAGHVGRALLSNPAIKQFNVIASDVRPVECLPDAVIFRSMDITNPENVRQIFSECAPDAVIHLASVVSPKKGSGRQFAYDIDVRGTQNIVDACLEHETRRLVVTSSGAAYGYHPENRYPLTEDSPIRGNYEFPYAYHKRLVEEMLAEVRQTKPALEQVILRVGTILGNGLENQITALFHKKRILALHNNESPFVFIWDTDLANIILKAAGSSIPGTFNVAGDGSLGIGEIATMLQKPVMRIPAAVLKTVLAIASPLGLTRYGPEQVRFLEYRPVLDNSRLKKQFGYRPEKTSKEAFRAWQKQAGL